MKKINKKHLLSKLLNILKEVIFITTNDKNKLKLNVVFLIYLYYILSIIINDCFCFIFKVNMSSIFYVISFIISGTILFLLRKNIKINFKIFNKFDFLMFFFIIFLVLLRATIPDSSYDTLNYHIYVQERLFSNNTSLNFFPARWINTFSLPLGDRCHYLIRLIFGYRLGFIFNVFCIITTYYLLKDILKKFIKNNDILVCIFSFFIIITEQLLSNMITYYVDLLSIPLFLFILKVLMDTSEKKSIFCHCLILFISGILVSLKISNAFLIMPFAIIYIYKNKKTISFKTILLGIIVFIFPIIIYLLNNYIQTGNPVFPFYNSIFKSKYLSNENWIEEFYGPKNILERLFWPIYVLFNPRRAFDTNTYYGRIGHGYIISMIVILISIYNRIVNKNKLNQVAKLSILYVILALIWSNFIMGYVRYALMLEILAGIIFATIIYNCIIEKNNKYFLITIFSIFSFIFVISFTISDLFNSNTEISWRHPYHLNKDNYKENFKYILNRKWDYSKQMKNVDCIALFNNSSAYAVLLDSRVKVFNINEGYANSYGEKLMNDKLDLCKNIYALSTNYTDEQVQNSILENKFKIEKRKYIFKADFINISDDIILTEISKPIVNRSKI